MNKAGMRFCILVLLSSFMMSMYSMQQTSCIEFTPCICDKKEGFPSNKNCCLEGAHSFLRPREITPNNMFQHNLGLYWWYHDVVCERSCLWWNMQISPLWQRSTQGNGIARYFLPCKQECITIKQDGTGNVGAPWLNLCAGDDEQYSSTLCLSPQRTATGAYFDVRFDISRLFCHSWINVSFAVIHVKHDLHMCEQLESAPGVLCDIATGSQALDQPDWLYGTFASCALTRKGVDDVQIRWGHDWFYCETNHLSPYLVGTIGTGRASEACHIFEPMVGSNHGSIGFGILGDCSVWICDADHELSILSDFKYRYVLRACERRSFDLCANGDWSRYLKVAREQDPAEALAGINALTYDVRVTPKSTIDWWAALHYQHCKWNVECGYDFWWRQKERIEFCYVAKDIGVYDLAHACSGEPTSAHCAQICQSNIGNIPQSDESFVILTCADLNGNSGAAPRAFSNTLYLACAYNSALCDRPAMLGAGGSYEWANGAGALDNWAVWIKAAMAY